MKLICEHCNKIFDSERKKRFCSKNCANLSLYHKNREKMIYQKGNIKVFGSIEKVGDKCILEINGVAKRLELIEILEEIKPTN